MSILYLDCGMGAAGDMLSAALLELLPDPQLFLDTFSTIGIPNVTVKKETAEKCGIRGTHIHVYVNGEEEGEDDACHEHGHHPHEHEQDHDHDHDHHHDHDHEHEHGHHHHDHDHVDCEAGQHGHTHHEGHHHHASMDDIRSIISKLSIPEKVKEDVLGVYHCIAEAESSAHGKPVSEIHFHEVGTMDAIADITMTCLLLYHIAPEKIIASPVCTGSGTVRCAHGILPVPAPATAFILQGIPAYAGRFESELCTPTGAALLKHFVLEYGPMPCLKMERIGYGMGKKDFPRANCVRAILGSDTDHMDEVLELSANIDDMTGEELAFAMDRLFEAGAVDVYTTPIGMKKNRPAVKLSVLVKNADKNSVINAIFLHTTTIGIRECVMQRYVMQREQEKIISEDGFSYVKKNVSGYHTNRSKVEFEDLATYALQNGISIRQAKEHLK